MCPVAPLFHHSHESMQTHPFLAMEKCSRPDGQSVFCINAKLFLNLDNSDAPLVGD